MSEKKEPSHHGIKEEISGEYPNETIKLLIERASCRSFEDRKIPEDIMALILEAGIHSATGGNLQPYSIIRIEEAEPRNWLAEICGQAFMAQAPTHLLFCIDWHRIERWAKLEQAPFTATDSFRHFWISFQDTVIAAQNICTAIDAIGLGSVYIGTTMESNDAVRERFDLPLGVFPVVLLCLGYPKGRLLPRKKLPPAVIVHPERYIEQSDEELALSFREKYPDLKLEATPERLARIKKCGARVHSAEFAKSSLARIEQLGYVSAVMRYFGLHYVADEMALGNEEFVAQTERAGFGWFREFLTPKRSE